MESAVVTWTISSVTEQQEYYVLFGTYQYNLNNMTNRILGSENTSLINQTYSTLLDGLTFGTTYYFVVVAEFGSTTLLSDVASFTTLEPGRNH